MELSVVQRGGLPGLGPSCREVSSVCVCESAHVVALFHSYFPFCICVSSSVAIPILAVLRAVEGEQLPWAFQFPLSQTLNLSN